MVHKIMKEGVGKCVKLRKLKPKRNEHRHTNT